MRVLVVEDDRALGLFLQKGLALEGHDVHLVTDGDTALEAAASQIPELVVLDLGLPRLDGVEVLKALRQHVESAAILVLTGRSPLEERIRCLDLGADDFMLKPFSFHELLARCRSLLRRRERFADPVLRFGGIEIDRMERSVRYEAQSIELTVREFRLLEVLAQRRGVCCSRAELLNEVWHTTPDSGTNIVDVYVTYLRRKLELAHPDDKLVGSAIETVRGKGYRLRDERRFTQSEPPSFSAPNHGSPSAINTNSFDEPSSPHTTSQSGTDWPPVARPA
jgi:DNA-binding response OmpR family regulator